MRISFWCILAVLSAPYILALASRWEAKRNDSGRDPRALSEGLAGWHRRAHLAHLNALEAVPAIIAGVMVAEFAHAPRPYVDAIAVAFVLFRLLHAVFYVADMPNARGQVFRLGLACIVALFIVAAACGRVSA